MQRNRTTLSQPMPKPSGALTAFLLLAILLAGSFLRFRNMTAYEPFIADEGAYHLEARYLYSLVQNAWESLHLKQQEQKTGENLWRRGDEARRFQENLEGRAPWYARPGHIYLLALSMAALGPDKVYLGGLVSSLFGTLCIPLVFGLTARLYHRGAGLAAAALFSFSGYQVAYCHSGLTEQDSLFFLLLAGMLHLASKREEATASRSKFLFATGLSLGVAFVIHYRTLVILLAFLLWEAFLQPTTDKEKKRERVKGLLMLSFGAVVPICLTEIPYYLLTLLVHLFFKTTLPFPTYFEQLIGQFFVSIYTNLHSTQQDFSVANLLTYPFLLWKLEGPLWPLVLTVSVLVCLRRRKPSDQWAAFFFFVPFLLCTFLQPRARYACSFLAFGAVMMGSVLAAPDRRPFGSPRRGNLLLLALLLPVLAMSSLHAFRAGNSRLSYRHAMDFILSQGSAKHLATYSLLSQVYVGVKNVPDPWPQSEEALRGLYEQGYRFIVIDLLKDVADLFLSPFNVENHPGYRDRLALLNRIEDSREPVYTVENLHVSPIQNIFEVNHNFWKTLSYYRTTQEIPRIRQIRVFDLREFFDRPMTEVPAAEGE